jgi:hypothetical protein
MCTSQLDVGTAGRQVDDGYIVERSIVECSVRRHTD